MSMASRKPALANSEQVIIAVHAVSLVVLVKGVNWSIVLLIAVLNSSRAFHTAVHLLADSP